MFQLYFAHETEEVYLKGPTEKWSNVLVMVFGYNGRMDFHSNQKTHWTKSGLSPLFRWTLHLCRILLELDEPDGTMICPASCNCI